MPTADDDFTRVEADAFTAGGEMMRAAVEVILLAAEDGAESVERPLLATLTAALRALPVMVAPDTPEDWAALIAIVERHLAHVHGRRGDGP